MLTMRSLQKTLYKNAVIMRKIGFTEIVGNQIKDLYFAKNNPSKEKKIPLGNQIRREILQDGFLYKYARFDFDGIREFYVYTSFDLTIHYAFTQFIEANENIMIGKLTEKFNKKYHR